MSPASSAAPNVREWPWWRVVLLSFGLLVLLLVGIVLTLTIGDQVSTVSPLPDRVNDLAGLPLVVAIYAAYARYVIRLPSSSFPIGRPVPAAAFWAAFGLGLPVTVLALLWATGSLTPGGTGVSSSAALGLAGESVAIGLVTAVIEEPVFRGYLYGLLEARWNTAAAIVAPAAVFAVLHQGHADTPAAIASVTATTFLAGVLLAIVVYRTGDVWNAILVHAGWNVVFAGRVVSVHPAGRPPEPGILVFERAAATALVPAGVPVGTGPIVLAVLLLAIAVVGRLEPLPGAGDPPQSSAE